MFTTLTEISLTGAEGTVDVETVITTTIPRQLCDVSLMLTDTALMSECRSTLTIFKRCCCSRVARRPLHILVERHQKCLVLRELFQILENISGHFASPRGHHVVLVGAAAHVLETDVVTFDEVLVPCDVPLKTDCGGIHRFHASEIHLRIINLFR